MVGVQANQPTTQPEESETTPTPSATWGSLLAELRRQQNLSQRQLAQLADMPRTFISKMERRDFPPTFVTVVRISTALRIDTALLLDQGTMRSYLVQAGLFADPFVHEVWQASRGLNAQQLCVIEATVKTLSEGQLPFFDWMTIESAGDRPAGV